MPRACLLVTALVWTGPLHADEPDPLRPPAITTENVPTVPDVLVDRLRQYNDVRRASFAGWDPAGRGILVETRFGNTTQLHRVYKPGGRREQITFLKEPVDGRFVPKANDGAIVLSASRGGDENDQLYALDRRTGRAVLLTDGESKNSLGPFRDDGAFVIVRSTRRNGKDFDLFVANPRVPGAMFPLLRTDGEYWTASDWSPDGDMLILNQYVSINETHPALLTWTVVADEEAKIDPAAVDGILATDAEVLAARQRVAFLEGVIEKLEKSAGPESPALATAKKRLAEVTKELDALVVTKRAAIEERLKAEATRIEVEKTPIPAPVDGQASYSGLVFGNDSRFVYGATDAGGEFRQLVRIATDGFDHVQLAPEIEWDVTNVEVAPRDSLKDVNLLAFAVNAGGTSDLYLLADDVAGKLRKRPRQAIVAGRAIVPNEPLKLKIPAGIVSGLEFSPDGRKLGFTLSPPNGPSDVHSIDLKTGEFERWTYSEVGGLDTSTFVEPELITYKSFDDRPIPAFVFRPRNASRETPVPVVIGIHGGPEGQYRPYFSPTDQFYLNEMGFAVIRPNVRGSAGYGKSYLKLDNGPLREDSVKDIGALLDWIATQPDLDASRVAVVGGSYGGYMVLASLTNFPDRLRAGVDYVGIASFKTFLENTKAYRRDLRRAEYGDERDPQMAAVFEKIDPLNNVGKITSALMVAHGVNDPRVPFSEAQQIVAAAKKNGLRPWTVYAEDEGHGFRKQANREYLTAATALFLWEQLQPAYESDEPK